MAMTKNQYFDQGRADAANGAVRSKRFTAKSWQENAYDEGYNAEFRRQAVAQADAERAQAAPVLQSGDKTTHASTLINPAEIRRDKRIDSMVAGYIAAALWSTGGETDPETGEELENLDDYEFSDNAKKAAHVICATFYDKHTADLGAFADLHDKGAGGRTEYGAYECAGHDLWLTSNGHGAGFWDRGMGRVGDRLAADCGFRTQFDSVDLYIAEDGFVNLA